MEYLVTAKEMRAYDTYTIEHIGIPALVLMERAALVVTQCVEEVLREKPGKVLCVCGTGNNGGDGLGVARLLLDRGIDVKVALIGDAERATKETQVQLAILQQYGIVPVPEVPEGEYALVVDALFGTGLSREVAGVYRQAIETMNEKGACLVAIDIPSGIDADTGAVWGTAVRADITVTLGFKKRGLFLYPGAAFAGTIKLADIG
ncbi:MAG: NAD(P)H-hydrate epimerase, partial [Lachnospiraceae bacterium]